MKTVLKTVVLVIIMMAATQIYGQASFGTGTVVSAPAGTSFYLWDNNKAFVPNQVALTSTTDATTVPTPPNGGIVYNTATAGSGTTAVTPGYYYNSGTTVSPVWVRYVAVGSQGTTGQMLTSQGTGVTPIWSNPGRLSNIVTYTSGSGTYTVPAGVTAIQVKMIGGGGAGGGAPYNSCTGFYFVGGGGGAGGYCEGLIISPAASYSYSVGTGGIGTTACTTAGGSGTNTTFGSFTAGGGSGGSYNSQGTLSSTVIAASGGAGGTSSGGNLNLTGASGYQGYSCSGNYYVSSGSGGSTMFGNGGPGITWYYGAYTFIKAGLNASSGALGAGGGGAFSTNSAGLVAGGNGTGGIIIIYEYK